LLSCNKKKEGEIIAPPPPPPPPPPTVFLKDITIPNLPSPHYHFEYDAAGKVIFFSYASGDRMYEVLYKGDKISEMRNNISINHDTLRYTYDAAGKVSVVKYIDEHNVNYKRCFLTYTGNQLQKIEWELKQPAGFIIDHSMTFTYLPDGNLSEMIDHTPPVNGQTESTRVTKFEQYDDKVNTDDFMIVHEGEKHMLLFPGLKLQRNNPGKETRTGTTLNYIIDYTYTYNNKGAVLTKTGDLLFTNGQNQGQRFQTHATQTYYE
jgi:hypothetical protein